MSPLVRVTLRGPMPNRRGRDGGWGDGTIVGVIAAMGIVMALTAFTLHRESQSVAASATLTASQSAWGRALASYTTLITLRAPLRIPAQWPAPWYM